jgi:poly-gamma-glutamate synthase PgsB/CapB
VINPVGLSSLLHRSGPARVQEQAAMLRNAVHAGADVIVLECMSLVPEYQQIETRLLQPTITLLTNIRDDHREQMGITDEDRRRAFSCSVPVGAHLVMHEEDRHPILSARALQLQSSIDYVPGNELLPLQCLPMQRENILLALHATRLLHIPDDVALIGIKECIDAEENHIIEFTAGKGRAYFVNGFAINDVPSARRVYSYSKDKLPAVESVVLILNTRSDRPIRSKLFAQWCADREKEFSSIILTGTHVPFTRRILRYYGVPEGKILLRSRATESEWKKTFQSIIDGATLIFGVGNMAGDGFTVVKFLQHEQQRSRL